MRFLLTMLVVHRFGPGLPIATFIINILGSFAIGIVAESTLTHAFSISPEARLFLAVGILGGFTTFSSYALETLTLIRDGSTPLALSYGLGSVFLGVFAAYSGTIIARLSTSTP
jgi:fluoride exporter